MTEKHLRFGVPSDLVTKESPLYQPPCYPPPDDWVMTVDENGKDLSRYGDGYWDFHAFSKNSFKGFGFAKHSITPDNLSLLKRASLFVLYHPTIFPGKFQSCRVYINALTKITKACDTKGILLSDLSINFPLWPEISETAKNSQSKQIFFLLHRLLELSDELGFVIANERLLADLALRIEHRKSKQHPYIPPRIWTYQVQRLDDCLDDFLSSHDAIRDTFDWIGSAYERNSKLGKPDCISPFSKPTTFKNDRDVYPAGPAEFYSERGLVDLFEKWLSVDGKPLKYELATISMYLNLVRTAAITYIATFSLQRIGEILDLWSDCFSVETDSTMGEICLITGETCKTDPDKDARWVVPKHVAKAIEVATAISELRLRHAQPAAAEVYEKMGILPLAMPAFEPWSARHTNAYTIQMKKLTLSSYSRIFDQREMTITAEDREIAVSLTPWLANSPRFVVGKPWTLSFHQLRRTGCVNMAASTRVSESTLQWQMKHSNIKMTHHYMHNYTNLNLNNSIETQLILESYHLVSDKIISVSNDQDEYVQPHGKPTAIQNALNLISIKEEQKLAKLSKNGGIACRDTLLGVCLKAGHCEYGGIESISKCAGTSGSGICASAIFHRKNENKLIQHREALDQQLKSHEKDSPRHSHLSQEIHAIGVYLDVINKQRQC